MKELLTFILGKRNTRRLLRKWFFGFCHCVRPCLEAVIGQISHADGLDAVANGREGEPGINNSFYLLSLNKYDIILDGTLRASFLPLPARSAALQ